MKKNKEELIQISKQIRKDIVEMLTESASGHPGGSLSAADIVTTLFFNELNINPENPKNAIAISPAVRRTVGNPWKASGISL